MKVNELPEDTNLTNIQVRLPKDILELFEKSCGGEEVMYIAGPNMGEFFMSPDSKESKTRRLYPLPTGIFPTDIIEWEVVE